MGYCKTTLKRLTAFKSTFILVLCSLLFVACSIDLTKIQKMNEKSHGKGFFTSIPLYFNGDTLSLDSNALVAYSKAIDTGHYPKEQCQGYAEIYATASPTDTTDHGKSAWFVGAAFIPLWPALPVNEIWSFKFNAAIYCNGNIVHKVSITEHEQVEAFFYGIFRVDLVNDAASTMHQKLIHRLQEDLAPHAPADFNNI